MSEPQSFDKLVCYFSGWFEIDVADVKLIDPQMEDPATGKTVVKTAAEWLAERGNIDGLILESFNDANAEATDGSFEELTLKIEKDDDEDGDGDLDIRP